MVPQHALMKRLLLACAAFAFAAHASAQDFLWEVSSLTNKVYLFGTVHAGKKSWYPLPKAVEEAFVDSAVLAVEADITDDVAMRKGAENMGYKPPDELKKHVPPEQYARMLKLLPRYGLTEAAIAPLKPFTAVSLLVFAEWMRSGFSPGFGVDNYLLRKAHAEQKPIIQLEGVETQTKLMDSLTEKQVQDLFRGTLDALEEDLTTDQIKGLVAAWQGGDANALLEVARRYNDRVAGAAEFEEKFIWQRHDDMARKIEALLGERRKPYFIAVGALHLAGPRGLVEMLRKRGYVVKQL
jgi:uncharacterized protein YbaP (TraB family)